MPNDADSPIRQQIDETALADLLGQAVSRSGLSRKVLLRQACHVAHECDYTLTEAEYHRLVAQDERERAEARRRRGVKLAARVEQRTIFADDRAATRVAAAWLRWVGLGRPLAPQVLLPAEEVAVVLARLDRGLGQRRR